MFKIETYNYDATGELVIYEVETTTKRDEAWRKFHDYAEVNDRTKLTHNGEAIREFDYR